MNQRTRSIAVALLCLSTAAWSADPAPEAISVALKQIAPVTLTVERVEVVAGSDKKFLIAGRADRNATISTYLRSLDTSSGFQRPELLQVAMNPEGRPLFEILVERKPGADLKVETATASKSAQGNAPTVYRCKVDGVDVFQSRPCPAAPAH